MWLWWRWEFGVGFWAVFRLVSIFLFCNLWRNPSIGGVWLRLGAPPLRIWSFTADYCILLSWPSGSWARVSTTLVASWHLGFSQPIVKIVRRSSSSMVSLRHFRIVVCWLRQYCLVWQVHLRPGFNLESFMASPLPKTVVLPSWPSQASALPTVSHVFVSHALHCSCFWSG